MVDIVDTLTRSMMMSRVKWKDTRQEVEIRRRLFALGFRYRLHDKKLPGKPDIVLPRYKAVIFLHGCFWHVHDCPLFRWPASRKSFWKKKLNRNRENDQVHIESLKSLGWRTLIVWECAYRAPGKNRDVELDRIAVKAAQWLRTGSNHHEIRGANVR